MNSKSITNLILVMLMAFTASVAYAQTTVKGHVVDELGEAVIGATVVQKGTKNATITDFDGNYSIKVPADATLSFSYVGYTTQEIAVAGKSQIDVTMSEDKKLLNEVVVVGYGQQKKESVIGAISQVSSAELLETPAANISQALAGKISGVVTNQASGAVKIRTSLDNLRVKSFCKLRS